MSQDDFYRALEEQFRASRVEIDRRLNVYLPFIAVLEETLAHKRAFDIGCGRGEWLEKLSLQGWQARGVDLDDAMLAACYERGLDAHNADALLALKEMPDSSLELVSSFHVVEHLSSGYLRALLKEIERVLTPGGLLILETPNGENLITGTNNFYLDPTHQRPVPSQFLAFLCQYSGFEQTMTLRLQEDSALHADNAHIGLWQVLYGVSPDYAVLAAKAPVSGVLSQMMLRERGLSLERLAVRHDEQQTAHFSGCEAKIERLQANVRQLNDELNASLSRLEQRAESLNRELLSVYSSRSWRITAPLRLMTIGYHWCQEQRRRLQSHLYKLLYVCIWRASSAIRSASRYSKVAAWLETTIRKPYFLTKIKALRSTLTPDITALSGDLKFYSPRQIQYANKLNRLLRKQQLAQLEQILPSNLPRMAYVSPLPPEKTGIADYSAELLPALAKHYQIDLIVREPSCTDGSFIAQDADWLRQHAEDFDVVLYHVGNSGFHDWMLGLLKEVPGIVVLHDFYLSGLIWALEENPECRGIKWQALYAEQGYLGMQKLLLAEDEGQIAFQYPFNRLLLEQAEGIIVHAPFSLHLAKHWYGSSVAEQWKVVPHLRQILPRISSTQARTQLQLPADAFVVCSFGLLGITKLNDRLLDAWFASSLSKDPNAFLVFVGECSRDEYGAKLRQRIKASGLAERIRITGWADMETFRLYLNAADAAAQLRTLSRGESSGTVLDCMAHELPVIVNAHGSMADLPDDALIKLPDQFVEQDLVEALERLWQQPDLRASLGRQAIEVIQAQHAPESCAQGYVQAIEQLQQVAAQKDEALLQALLEEKNQSDCLGLGAEALLGAAGKFVHSVPSAFAKPQLLIDVTATCRHDLHTGIERVVRALTLAFLQAPPEGWRIEPVYLSDEGGVWHYRYAQAWTSRLLGMPTQIPDGVADYAVGDRVLALDISGQSFIDAQSSGLYRRLQADGVRCHMLLHDLLPLTCPEYFPPTAHRYFEPWLKAALAFDSIVCSSKTVSISLRDWLAEHGLKGPKGGLGFSHHGADLSSSAPSLGLPESAWALLDQLAQAPTLLMVGTLEPRKGHLQVLEAMELLWQQGHQINLVIVGKEGWLNLPDDQRRLLPELMRRLRQHPQSNQRLFWLTGISDEYLEHLYATAQGLIAASWDEGFGLPLIEAAQHDLPILARDIPIFREVAGVHARYFVAETSAPLADAIASWVQEGCTPSSQEMPWLYWKDSAQNLWQQLCKNVSDNPR